MTDDALQRFALSLQVQLKEAAPNRRVRLAKEIIAREIADVGDQNVVAALVFAVQSDPGMHSTSRMLWIIATLVALGIGGVAWVGYRSDRAVLRADENGCYNAMARSVRVTSSSASSFGIGNAFAQELDAQTKTKADVVAEYKNQENSVLTACTYLCNVWAKQPRESDERKKLFDKMVACLEHAAGVAHEPSGPPNHELIERSP